MTAAGGPFSGSGVAASVTIDGKAAGAGDRGGPSLEGVTPTLTYFAKSAGSTTNLGAAPPVATGTYFVIAFFPGSADYASTQSAPVDFTITRGSAAVVLTTSTDAAVFGQPVDLVATVQTTGGTPDGDVRFFDGETLLSSSRVDRSGRARVTISSFALGTHSVTASYDGGNNFLDATSRPNSVLVSAARTKLVFMPHAVMRKKQLLSVALTALVEPIAPGGGIPTGTVTFMFKKRTLGTANLTGGKATLTLNAKTVLNKTITVRYSGAQLFSPSTLTLRKTIQQSLKTVARPVTALLERTT